LTFSADISKNVFMPYTHETSPEKEFEIAKQALASNDLAHAAYHVGTALASSPTNGEWLGLLDEVIARSPDVLTLLRLDAERSDFVTAATRAYALAELDKYPEALDLICTVAEVRPDAPFLIWAVEWLQRPDVAASFDFDFVGAKILSPIMRFVGNCPSPMELEDPRRGNVQAALDMFGLMRENHSKEPFLSFANSLVLRRLGRMDEAQAYAYEAFQLEGNWANAIGLACAYRDASKVEDAVGWYRHALSLEPEDLSSLLDIGDCYLENDRFDDAIAAFEEVLEKQEKHPWAEPSIVFARYKKEGNQADKNLLFALADHSGRAWSLYCQIQPPQEYVHVLPRAADATANFLRGVIRQITENPPKEGGGNIDINVSHPESPSVLTAFRLFTESLGVEIGINLNVEQVQTPDPRALKGQVDFSIWAYEGVVARPNGPRPDPAVLEAVAHIARTTYNLEIYAPMAAQAAAALGPGWYQHVAFSMVHPPPLPNPNWDPFDWVMRCQIAAAMIIAHLDDGWEGSVRQRGLWALALGCVDWTVDAALIAMAWLGRYDPHIREAVIHLFGWLETQIPQEGYTSFEYPLFCSWLAMGDHDEETAQRLQEAKARIEQDSRKTPEDQPERHGGLTLAEYAEFSARRDEILGKHTGGIGAGLLAMAGSGSHPEIQELCAQYNIDSDLMTPGMKSGAAGAVPGWDKRINADAWVEEQFTAMKHDARLKAQGIEFNSHEGRVAEMIRAGKFDVEAAAVDAAAVAEQRRENPDDGDPDPVVFPGQAVERVSDYVRMMKMMQTGDMMAALAAFGLDMGSYGAVAQAWGVKLAADPMLNAKFSEMMQS
jgi:tetratricopeptide (TPR) repeat protein